MTTFLEEYMRGSVEVRNRAKMVVPEGFRYQCFEDYVLRKGHQFESTALTSEEETIVQETLDRTARKGMNVHEQKQCFANAQRFCLYAKGSGLTYYEGYACGLVGFPVHHGWVGINGKVIDLTWRLEEPDTSRSLLSAFPVGELPEHYCYWGFPIEDPGYIRCRMFAREMIGSVLDDWEGGYPLLRGIDPNDEESWKTLFEGESHEDV